jgi:hypothetical protein
MSILWLAIFTRFEYLLWCSSERWSWVMCFWNYTEVLNVMYEKSFDFFMLIQAWFCIFITVCDTFNVDLIDIDLFVSFPGVLGLQVWFLGVKWSPLVSRGKSNGQYLYFRAHRLISTSFKISRTRLEEMPSASSERHPSLNWAARRELGAAEILVNPCALAGDTRLVPPFHGLVLNDRCSIGVFVTRTEKNADEDFRIVRTNEYRSVIVNC